MLDQWRNPIKIYLRLWPLLPGERERVGKFRYQESGSDQRQEYRVRFARQHAVIPQNSLQYEIWDELRTQLALGERPGSRVWPGMAFTDLEYHQQHAFWLIEHEGRDLEIIGLHYHNEISQLRVRADPDGRGYRDWAIDRRRNQEIRSCSELDPAKTQKYPAKKP